MKMKNIIDYNLFQYNGGSGKLMTGAVKVSSRRNKYGDLFQAVCT
jgi:hypothetical protein